MRKVFVSLLAISFFILTLSGCTESVKPLQPYFTSDCVVSNAGTKLEMKLCSSYNDNIIATVSKGEVLSGLEFQKNNSTLYLRYNDLECIASEDYLPYFCGVDVLFDTLSCCQNNTVSYSSTQGKYDVYIAKLECCDCEIYADSDSGKIVKILPKLYKVSITFDNVKIQKKAPATQ